MGLCHVLSRRCIGHRKTVVFQMYSFAYYVLTGPDDVEFTRIDRIGHFLSASVACFLVCVLGVAAGVAHF